MTDSRELLGKLEDYFRSNVLYDESMDEINKDESLIDNGYIDSTGIIVLVGFLEDTFKIKIHDNEIIPENFNSINRIYKYISEKVENLDSVGMGR